MTTPPVLDLQNVSKSFATPEGWKKILSGISYQIPDLPGRGEFVVVVGPSGCGKTTLLNLIAGLSNPTEGTIECLGTRVTDPGPDRAFVFQSHNEFPWRTVLDNVAMGLEFSGVSKKERHEIAHKWLVRVGLGSVVDRYPKQLSGGMRQRLALARSLTQQPRVLLMDEPFGALDVLIRLGMQDLLRSVWGETEGTIVMVTHDISEAVYLADEILIMAPDPGRIHRVVQVPFGFARTRAIEQDPRFRDLVSLVTNLVREVARVG